jgi:osmoprotectant transport system permease protein
MIYLVAHPDASRRASASTSCWSTFVSLAIALAIALPLGVLAARHRAPGRSSLGDRPGSTRSRAWRCSRCWSRRSALGPPTAIVALVAYAQMILVRATSSPACAASTRRSRRGRGMGFTPRSDAAARRVPAALPAIVGGVRIATVTLVALATVAAWIDAGGLGVLLFEGILTQNDDKIVAGALAAAALAIVADLALRGCERAVRR